MHAPHVLKIDVEAIIRSTHNELLALASHKYFI